MAHTKALGSTKLGRESAAQRSGIKVNHGQKVKIGEIIIRQRGTKYLPGTGIVRAGDDTLYAGKDGRGEIQSENENKIRRQPPFRDDGKR